MPEELKIRVAESAAANGRSVHSELLLRLSTSFEQNKTDADASRAGLQLAESRLRETLLMQQAFHMGHCITFLLHAINGPDPKGVTNVFPDLLEISGKAAKTALAYEREINPAIRLEEYRRSIEEAKEMLRVWQFEQLPFFGEGPVDDTGPTPLTSAQRRKLMLDALDAYDKVIVRKSEPVPPRKVNRGPERSPNARKPKA